MHTEPRLLPYGHSAEWRVEGLKSGVLGPEFTLGAPVSSGHARLLHWPPNLSPPQGLGAHRSIPSLSRHESHFSKVQFLSLTLLESLSNFMFMLRRTERSSLGTTAGQGVSCPLRPWGAKLSLQTGAVCRAQWFNVLKIPC